MTPVTAKLRVTVTKVERHDVDGCRPYYTANASINGSTRTYHNRFGSWMSDRRPIADSDRPTGAAYFEPSAEVAAALQAHLPRIDRRRR